MYPVDPCFQDLLFNIEEDAINVYATGNLTSQPCFRDDLFRLATLHTHNVASLFSLSIPSILVFDCPIIDLSLSKEIGELLF